jgi:hypothetical protein
MRWTTIFSLLLGALLFTFGCEPETPEGDDDDDVSDDDDDDVIDDDDVGDDDDSEEMYMLYISSECDGIDGLSDNEWPYKPVVYIDDVGQGNSPMTVAMKRGEHKIQVKGDTILSPDNFIVNVSEESDDIDQIEGNDDIDGEVFIRCGLAPNGEYRAYEDADCTIPKDNVDPYFVETKIGYWDGSPDEIVMENLIVDMKISSDQGINESGSATCRITADLESIKRTSTSENFYCLH